MRNSQILFLCLILVLGATACAAEGPSETAEQGEMAAMSGSALETDDEKILYALGLAVAQQLSQFGLNEQEMAFVQQGVMDAALKREPKVEMQTWGPKLQQFAQTRMAAGLEAEKAEAASFLEAQAAAEGAEKTASGLIYTELEAGTGDSPAATDEVTVHYHGTLRDGTVFDSSVDRGTPATFTLNQVIPCWQEGLQRMKTGGKGRLVCPAAIAYGDAGRPGIPPGAPLVFEVELISIGSSTATATE